MLSLQPPQSKWPLLSLAEPFFLGSQEQDFSSPWLHALVMAKTTPAEEMACTKADSRLPETKEVVLTLTGVVSLSGCPNPSPSAQTFFAEQKIKPG